MLGPIASDVFAQCGGRGLDWDALCRCRERRDRATCALWPRKPQEHPGQAASFCEA